MVTTSTLRRTTHPGGMFTDSLSDIDATDQQSDVTTALGNSEADFNDSSPSNELPKTYRNASTPDNADLASPFVDTTPPDLSPSDDSYPTLESTPPQEDFQETKDVSVSVTTGDSQKSDHMASTDSEIMISTNTTIMSTRIPYFPSSKTQVTNDERSDADYVSHSVQNVQTHPPSDSAMSPTSPSDFNSTLDVPTTMR